MLLKSFNLAKDVARETQRNFYLRVRTRTLQLKSLFGFAMFVLHMYTLCLDWW
jgi:hypothetical protein